jgi:hypothetical protein
MTREDLIPLAQDAIITHPNANPFDFRLMTIEQLECFARLVIEAERERCEP